MNIATSPVTGRIADLRHALAAHDCAAIIVPSSDPHISEYLPERWQGRRWLSGFTGSMATLVVTAGHAGLWVDGRYWTQAETELAGTGIAVMRIPSAASTMHVDWLADNLSPGATVAIDGDVLSVAAARELKSALDARGIVLKTDLDILGEIWSDRPGLSLNPVYEHLPPHAAVARREKLAMLHAELRRLGADWHLVSSLDDIAWIFNLRGSDLTYAPVFAAHALLGHESAVLFVADGKIDPVLADRLRADGVTLARYDEVGEAVSRLPANAGILFDPGRVTLGLIGKLPEGIRRVEMINPSTFAKSKKTDAEAAHVREVMAQDGAALCEFFAWFESARKSGERITELTVDEQVCAARARRSGFVNPSFATIAGFNANGAMPHYHATALSHAVIEGDGLLLIDSGGQYLGGTTDITRVIAVGHVTDEQRADFTRVLKGMIQLSLAKFPRGTRSPRLDAIARAPIWAAGVDYGHGTGHGVGYFLNVHEGPQSISPHAVPMAQHAMEPGMITSNEPGIYRVGRWGVRIENLLLNVPAGDGEFGEFLAFETLTICPIDTRCVERSLLDSREVYWLNAYHATVRKRLQGMVEGDTRRWLLNATEPI